MVFEQKCNANVHTKKIGLFVLVPMKKTCFIRNQQFSAYCDISGNPYIRPHIVPSAIVHILSDSE